MSLQILNDRYTYYEYYETPATTYTYATLVTALNALASAQPSWSLVNIGSSEQGNALYAMVVNGTGYTKTILITGGIHGTAAEKPAVRATMDLLYFLTEHPTMFTTTRFVVVPMINPEGCTAAQRKNINNTPATDDGKSPWPRSVDLGRNFSAYWGKGSASSDPSSLMYRGPEAGSESETAAAINVVTTYSPDYHIACHGNIDSVLSENGNYAQRKATSNNFLTQDGYTAYPTWEVCEWSGQFGNYTNSLGIETYTVEIGSGTDHYEINRLIGLVQGLLNSFSNDTLATVNNFKNDSNCLAWYQFNKGNIARDTLNLNDLTDHGTITADLTNYREGNSSAQLVRGSSQYYSIADASLTSGFPLKSGTTNKEFTFGAWIRLDDLPANTYQRVIAAKWDSGSNQRSCMLCIYNNDGTYSLRMYIAYNSGASSETMDVTFSPSINTWYYVAFSFKDSDKSWYGAVYDTSGLLASGSGTATNNIYLSTAPFLVGCIYITGAYYATTQFGGRIDDLMVFNAKLSATKIAAIWANDYRYTSQSITPGTGALTFSGTVSTITGGGAGAASVTPATGALTLTGYVPSITASDHKTMAPSTGSLLMTANIPTVSATDHKSMVPTTGSLLMTANVPTVTASDHKSVTPALGTLALTGKIPDVTISGTVNITPSTGALAFTGKAPTISATAAVSVIPATGSLSATSHTPTITASNHKSMTPPAGTLTLTGNIPTVAASANASASPLAGSLVLTGKAPTISTTALLYITPGTGTLTFTGYVPSVTTSGSLVVNPGTGSLIFTGKRPDLKGYLISWSTTCAPVYLMGTDRNAARLTGIERNAAMLRGVDRNAIKIIGG